MSVKGKNSTSNQQNTKKYCSTTYTIIGYNIYNPLIVNKLFINFNTGRHRKIYTIIHQQ